MKRLHALAVLLAPGCALAQTAYLKPPPEIQKVIEAPRRPDFALSPSRDKALLLYRTRYLSISDLAQPMLALGGIRINPVNNAPARVAKFESVTIKDIAKGTETPLILPANGTVWTATWSPDGRRIAFPVAMTDHTELWVADAATGNGHSVESINATMPGSYRWMPDSKRVVVRAVPNRGTPPSRTGAPTGPEVQESLGSKRPARTYPDMLKDPIDDQAFTYYMTSQLELVDVDSFNRKTLGVPGVLQAQLSPNGKYLLVEVTHAPYSHRIGASGFPHRTEIWPVDGGNPAVIHDAPSEEGVPLDGVAVGPRNIEWRADKPDTLVWVEALDEGNPEKKVEFRDRIVTREMGSEPRQIAKLQERCEGIYHGSNGLAIIQEYVRDTEHDRRYVINLDQPSTGLKRLSDISSMENYANPGDPLQQMMPNGQAGLVQSGNSVLFAGVGSSPEGDRPFLDRVDLTTLKTERIWRCDSESYEAVVAAVQPDGSEFITLRESPVDYPNYVVRRGDSKKALTQVANPYPQLTSIQKQLVKYKRSDGVECSFTLYLPPGYKQGDRLPAIINAYPLEYTSADVAGQVTGSTKRFPTLSGPLLFVLAGYAVMNNVTMPIVGDPKTVNDTFVSQLVDDAKAAVAKGDQMGVIDPKRVGIMGHSYGAFMTANLLAHSDVIAAGAAESGAYNRSLTPFGFQSERRTFWQAQKMYLDVSPFAFADKIKRPLLLIHGMQDDNPGTYTIQSERMFQALSGNGGTTRLVLLPYEAHGYTALESIEHVFTEELNWFDKYVKGKS